MHCLTAVLNKFDFFCKDCLFIYGKYSITGIYLKNTQELDDLEAMRPAACKLFAPLCKSLSP